MNESIHGERTASEPQDRVTELIEQQTAISEVLRAIASSPHDLQPIFDTILENATRLCRADGGGLGLFEENGFRIVAVEGRQSEFGRWDKGRGLFPASRQSERSIHRKQITHPHPRLDSIGRFGRVVPRAVSSIWRSAYPCAVAQKG